MMTMITQVFGVRGEGGDLVLYPKLLAEQFDSEGNASVAVSFAGQALMIVYENPHGKDFGDYIIASASCDGQKLEISEDAFIVLPRNMLTSLPDETHDIHVRLI